MSLSAIACSAMEARLHMGGDFDCECLVCAQIIDQRALPHRFIVEDVRTVMCACVCVCVCVCVCGSILCVFPPNMVVDVCAVCEYRRERIYMYVYI